jgi:Meckel syndrome type 1 protein
MSLPALRLLPGADASAPVPVRPAQPARAPALRLVVAWPAAPMPVVARPALTPFMRRCLLLAALLHVWLVLMLGNAPGGTAAPGQGVAGTLNITLQGPVTPGATQEVLPPAPAVPEGPTGTAVQPRWGGQVRSEAPAVAAEPGAAQLGRWAAEPGSAAEPAPPPPPGRVLQERAAAEPAALALSEPPALAPVPVAAPNASPEPAPAPPIAQALPAAAAATPAPPAPQPAPAERSLQAPAVRAPAAALAPIEPLAPAAALPALATDLPPAAAPLQRLARPAVPAPPAPPVAAVAPLAAEPLAAAPAPLAPPALPAQAVPTVAAEPASGAAVPSAAPARPAPASPPALPTLKAGQPDAGSQLGRDVATPPAPAASVLPRLNLTLQRPRGGELSRGRSAGALPVLPRPPEVDEKLGRDIAKSARADCREAYRAVGLAAAVPLVADAVKPDSGCKW